MHNSFSPSLRRLPLLTVLLICFLLGACSSLSTIRYKPRGPESGKGSEVVLFALGLIDTGYRFGGKNPEAGLDCSGMVAYIYDRSLGLKVSGSAADIARRGQPIDRSQLRPGDLVFFNTRNAPLSHVGVYIGNNRFVHAPSTNGRVRIDSMHSRYFAQRYETARSYFD